MEKLNELISEFENVIIKKHSPILGILEKGITPEDIRNALKQVDLNSDVFITLYGWKNGVLNMEDRAIGEMELFARGIMLPLQNAIEHYQAALSENLWEKNLFPIFTTGGGDYLLLSTNSKSETAGSVLIYSPSILLSDKPVIIYENLELLFQTVIECFKLNAYYYNKDGTLEVNYNLEQEISKRKNPNAEYWD